jgi:hypothetical protein
MSYHTMVALTLLPILAEGRGGGSGLPRLRGAGVGPHRVPPTVHGGPGRSRARPSLCGQRARPGRAGGHRYCGT